MSSAVILAALVVIVISVFITIRVMGKEDAKPIEPEPEPSECTSPEYLAAVATQKELSTNIKALQTELGKDEFTLILNMPVFV